MKNKNNETDYQPLVELAKENQRPFIATNVPRRYASIVFRSGIQGLDSISDEAKKWMKQLLDEFDVDKQQLQDQHVQKHWQP